MTAFRIPKKLHVINSDDDARILNQTGAVYSDGDISAINGTEGFSIEGLTPNIFGNELVVISGTTRISKEAAVSAVSDITAFEVGSTSAAAGLVFRLVWESLNHEEVEMQNFYKEKQYQISAAQASAAAIATNIAAVINADKNSPVTAAAGFNNVTPVQDDSAKVVLFAKETGVDVRLYAEDLTLTQDAAGVTVYHTAEDTSAVTVDGTRGVGNYGNLKTEKYADYMGLNIDTEVKWHFQPGVQYQRYRFLSNKANQITTGGLVEPSEVTGQSQVEFELFVRAGISLEAAMDVLAADVNV